MQPLRELSDEEKEYERKQQEYCNQYLPKGYKITSIQQNEEDTLPTHFKIIEEDSNDISYISGYLVDTPYGIKKNILFEMKKSGLYNLQKNKEYSFDTYKVTKKWQEIALNKSKEYVKNFDKDWLVITGLTGSGKTHLGTSIVFGLASKCISTHYLSWVDFMSDLKADFDTAGSKVEYVKTRKVLYIDDFLKTGLDDNKPRDYDLEIARNIIWHRYDNNLPTIISSEFDLESDISQFNDALSGRILEMSGDYVIAIGKDKKTNYRRYKGE